MRTEFGRQGCWRGARGRPGGPLTTALVVALLAATAALATHASPIAAQEEAQACRCVDADGNEIENCRCFRTPDFTQVAPRLALLGDQRARLGISVDVRSTPDADVEGARVVDVLEDGPAEEAGIREGDIVTHVDGQSLSEPIEGEADRDFDLDASVPAQRLLALVREIEPGESVEVAYVRDGRQQTTLIEAQDLAGRWGDVTAAWTPRLDAERLRRQLQELGERSRARSFRVDPDLEVLLRRRGPDGELHAFGRQDGDVRVFGPDGALAWGLGGLARGLDLVEMNPALGEYFGTETGVLVADVGRDSTLGLEPGDVVLSVGGREVTAPAHLRRILASYGQNEEIELTIVREGERTTVTGPMRRP